MIKKKKKVVTSDLFNCTLSTTVYQHFLVTSETTFTGQRQPVVAAAHPLDFFHSATVTDGL